MDIKLLVIKDGSIWDKDGIDLKVSSEKNFGRLLDYLVSIDEKFND